ncbi:MAG TPA: hypothetical protein VKV26_06215 [Dehalococcoidia bacterium]|nr:hypothetical protein [Dehalococcoidia bacterium]
MGDDHVEALLLRDDRGQAYLVPRALLEQCRLSAQQFAEMEQETVSDEVGGYLFGAAGLGQAVAGTFFTLGVVSPRDAATGQASGKRQWTPVHLIQE